MQKKKILIRKKPQTELEPQSEKRPEVPVIPKFPVIDILKTEWAQENLNAHITTELRKMIQKAKTDQIDATDRKVKTSHGYRIRQFENACATLENHHEPITSSREAQKLKGIGPGIAKRIQEILDTGALAEIENRATSQTTTIIIDLMKVSGIGEASARKLVEEHKITSLDDLKARADKIKLTHHIRTCLKHFDDIRTKIPHATIIKIDALIKHTVQEHFPNVKMEICGSYRRKKAESGDIDVLITAQNGVSRLTELVNVLTTQKFLAEHLTGTDKTKYMGICMFEGRAHRIDIRWVDQDSYGAAVLYFTGSKKFNQIFRQICLDRGMTLNEYGLYLFKDGEKILIPTHTERDIFDRVGIRYIEPPQREL